MDPTYKGFSVPTPSKSRSGKLNLRRALMIGGGALTLFIIIGLLANLFSSDTTTISQRLLYRVDALNTLTNSARTNITDDTLAKINADLSIVLTGDNAALTKVIPTEQMTTELTQIKTAEADAASLTKLKTAKINGQYDATYKTVLMQKIEETNALITELWGKSSKSSVKSALVTLNDHLKVYYAELKALQ